MPDTRASSNSPRLRRNVLRAFSTGCFSAISLLLWSLLLTGAYARAQTETLLYSFSGSPDGAAPYAALVRGKHGKFYGTTTLGGASNLGTIFEVTTKGKEKVLHSFSGADGASPSGGLVLDKNGNLYGATWTGGTYNSGAIFVLSPSGVETVLYSFTGGTDGADPIGPLVFDKKGNLYGSCSGGGASGVGVVFKVDPSGQESVLYSFKGFNGGADGIAPNGGLVLDSKGNLYGTTAAGGAGGPCPGDFGCGTVFMVSPNGSEQILHSFQGNAVDGFYPVSGLVRDQSGNLYGTTNLGGQYDRGAAFVLTPSGFEAALSFGIGVVGYYPAAPLLLDKAGNLFGTNVYASNPPCDCGAVFEITSTWNDIEVYDFNDGYHPDGTYPYSGLIFGAQGRLYGTTSAGGAFNKGAVFEVTP